MIKTIIYIYLFMISTLHAYVPSETPSEKPIKWTNSKKQLDIILNPNSWSLMSSDVIAIVQESIDEWDEQSPFDVNLNVSYSASSSKRYSSISFEQNSGYFGSGVLAVTSVNYSSQTGEISNASILVNESMSNPVQFNSDPTSTLILDAYLGDVITHELGHLYGLSHTETSGSSMFFSVFRGQSTISEEDTHSLNTHYSMNTGRSISGDVIGGSGVGIFGAFVQLIDVDTAKVAASVITDDNGHFSFTSVGKGRYSAVVSPLKETTMLASKYNTVKANFCPGSYVISSYSKCGGRNEGHPQIFDLEDEINIDAGSVTISCQTNSNKEYLSSKLSNDDYYEIDYYNGTQINHGAFWGTFFDNESKSTYAESNYDRFELDLSDLDSSSGSYDLKLNIASAAFFNKTSLRLDIKRADEIGFTTYDPSINSLNLLDTDRSITLNLSTDPSDNVFYIHVTPQLLTDDHQQAMYGDPENFVDNPNVYMMTFNIVNTYGQTQFGSSSFPYEDNLYCTDGEYSYAVKKYTDYNALQSSNGHMNAAASCATIKDQGTGLFFTLMLGFLSILLGWKTFRKIYI